jgi:hypothetical protein
MISEVFGVPWQDEMHDGGVVVNNEIDRDPTPRQSCSTISSEPAQSSITES